MVDAIVLAGAGKALPFKDVGNKALLEIKGKYMVQYVLDSLKSAKCIEKVVVLGPKELDKVIGNSVSSVLSCEESIIDNVKKGMAYLGENRDVLICTSDIPMISVDAVEDFVKQCEDRKVDIGYPIIEKSLNDSKYPDAKRTYVKLKDGIFTGGNILYINTGTMEKCCNVAGYLVANRKNPLKMARVFGPLIFVKLFLGILTIEAVESRINKLLHINARAIITEYPEIGNDVDKVEDVDFVNKYINVSA